jgi:chromosome segregation ATPase
MSKTGRNKKLASFNCDQRIWEQFIARCKSKGTTATATLIEFIELYLGDSQDKADAIGGNNLDKRLDSQIKASVEKYLVTSNNSNASPTNETIRAICERLDKLESEFSNESSNQTTVIDNLANLEQKIEKMTARMTQLAEAIIKIQDYLNNQQKRGQKSYYSNSSFQGQSPRMQPLTEEGLAKRLGVSEEAVRKERINLPPPLFVAWCKNKDRAGLGWEFNENTGLYQPAS